MPDLLHHLPLLSAQRRPDAIALTSGKASFRYGELAQTTTTMASALVEIGLLRGERVAIYLEKRPEAVIATFACSQAGGVFVPVNPLLKPDQVAHILRDCNVRILVTSPERLATLGDTLKNCHDLRHVVVTGAVPENPAPPFPRVLAWQDMANHVAHHSGHRVIDLDMAAILYTSGSTGRPKGVVLSHRNVVSGARSVAQYLENREEDVLLAALPLSFDAGFSQVTTAFLTGARVVLLNYLLPRDVLKAVTREGVTGLTGVPPLWIQLAQLDWPSDTDRHLRYFANTGGRMPGETLRALRAKLPRSRPFLMYGLTEAFRATYLPPEEVDRRPDSIGRAVPNSQVLVLREDGSECAPHEPGELVQRGALVSLGYWNDPARTAERFRPLPSQANCRESGLVLPEIAVFSGDTVRRDEEGFLYFVGRRDEMIKTSGYRVSPTEIEEVLYATGAIAECAAFGVPHPQLGQTIVAYVVIKPGTTVDLDQVLQECRVRMPAYMVPSQLIPHGSGLPRNPNGKIDRVALAQGFSSGETSIVPSGRPI
ncbi:MAG: acyl-CoA ligase (AMP-forming), exosortase A system-associated [Zoogloeaceae bacterium]|nr:acyl-CoA ligase (AMP-forming), exosortase A system-associated [Zoogloeaceae bacterium]